MEKNCQRSERQFIRLKQCNRAGYIFTYTKWKMMRQCLRGSRFRLKTLGHQVLRNICCNWKEYKKKAQKSQGTSMSPATSKTAITCHRDSKSTSSLPHAHTHLAHLNPSRDIRQCHNVGLQAIHKVMLWHKHSKQRPPVKCCIHIASKSVPEKFYVIPWRSIAL